jgi:hypothetical protein
MISALAVGIIANQVVTVMALWGFAFWMPYPRCSGSSPNDP